jgi:hypothetical protein
MVVRHPFGFRKDDKGQSPSESSGVEKRSCDAGEFEGLCVNCANRETCLVPKPEGGVWHCEEYVEER